MLMQCAFWLLGYLVQAQPALTRVMPQLAFYCFKGHQLTDRKRHKAACKAVLSDRRPADSAIADRYYVDASVCAAVVFCGGGSAPAAVLTA
jgi:hypothetical protein